MADHAVKMDKLDIKIIKDIPDQIPVVGTMIICQCNRCADPVCYGFPGYCIHNPQLTLIRYKEIYFATVTEHPDHVIQIGLNPSTPWVSDMKNVPGQYTLHQSLACLEISMD